MDKISVKRLEKIHPKLKQEVKQICDELDVRNLSVRFTDVLRTFAEQDDLYAQGRTKKGKIVTNARGGQSYHNYGLAIDFCLLKPCSNGQQEAIWDMDADLNANTKSDWQEVVFVFKLFGWEWGGDWVRFQDTPHFQKTFGFSTRELLKKVNNGEVDANGYVAIP